MEDEKIIGLYWERNEDAITETSSKYGKLFFRIASNILLNHEDSEECVNDTYFGLWNAIPKERPSPFSVFASRITRNLALKKFGLKVQQLRKEVGMSQEKFALSIDMDRTYLASVEAGRRNISINNIKKIADGLSITISELFVGIEILDEDKTV